MMRLTAAALLLGLLAGMGVAHADEVLGRDSHVAVSVSAKRHVQGDPRPSRWCGWQMRQWLGVADRAGNRAIWWARYGSNAHGPAVGVIVVWRHHVGIITGKGEQGWIVKSGNDGHAVRERERSLRGVIAYRLPGERMASR
jgi:hypothetical protein